MLSTNLSYWQKLSILQLDSLHLRRIKADLLLCYKMINNLVDVDVATFFALSYCRLTRSNGVKLKKSYCCSTCDANFFSNRVINIWNSLPSHIVQAPSVATFRKRLCDFNFPSSVVFKLYYCIFLFFFVWAFVSVDFVCLGVLWRCSACLQCHTVSYVYVK